MTPSTPSKATKISGGAKKKRLVALFGAGLLTLTAALAPISVCDAAVGGARMPRMSAPRPAPRPATPRPSTNTTQNARPNQQYKPSQSNQQANTNANARAKTGTQTAPQAAPKSGSRWGNALRNIGLLAGGMFLGSMLANMLGLGGFGDIFGLLMNGILIYAAIRAVLWAINRFRGKNSQKDDRYTLHTYNENPYARQNAVNHDAYAAENDAIPDIRPPQSAAGKGGQNYLPRRTADWYRNH